MPASCPEEFRDVVVRVAENRVPGVTIEDLGVRPVTRWKWLRRLRRSRRHRSDRRDADHCASRSCHGSNAPAHWRGRQECLGPLETSKPPSLGIRFLGATRNSATMLLRGDMQCDREEGGVGIERCGDLRPVHLGGDRLGHDDQSRAPVRQFPHHGVDRHCGDLPPRAPVLEVPHRCDRLENRPQHGADLLGSTMTALGTARASSRAVVVFPAPNAPLSQRSRSGRYVFILFPRRVRHRDAATDPSNP